MFEFPSYFQDPEKVPAPVGFQPFSSSHTEDDRDDRDERGVGRIASTNIIITFMYYRNGPKFSDRPWQTV